MLFRNELYFSTFLESYFKLCRFSRNDVEFDQYCSINLFNKNENQ